MANAIYSLAEVVTTLTYGSAQKRKVLSEAGGGRISISYSGDLASHTISATGYVVINKLVAKGGTCNVEVPVNSEADKFMRGWINFVKTSKDAQFANAQLVLKDNMAGRTITLSNVVPQKEPDESYDATSANRQYNLLFAEMTVVGGMEQ